MKEINEEDRWKFLDEFRGDVFTYGDGSVAFSPRNSELPPFHGKTWLEAVNRGVKLYRNALR